MFSDLKNERGNVMSILRLVFVGLVTMMCASSAFADLQEGKKAVQEKRWREAMDVLRPLADAGDAEAQYLVGSLWFTGGTENSVSLADTLPVDKSQAIKYFEMSAKQGNACGAYAAGTAYYRGHGVSVNESKAKDYFKIAADAEKSSCEGRAAWMLAVLLADGAVDKWIVTGNQYEKVIKSGAVEYAKRAAESGVDFSVEHIASLSTPATTNTTVQQAGYGTANMPGAGRQGVITTPQQFLAKFDAYKESIKRAESAEDLAERQKREDEEDDKLVGGGGVGKAIGNFFSLMLDNDQSVSVDEKIKRHKESDSQEKASVRLGVAFDFLLKHDYEHAFQLYKHLADRGYFQGMVFTGLMMHDGLGVPKDEDGSFKLLSKGFSPIAFNGGPASPNYDFKNATQQRRNYFAHAYFYLGNLYAEGARCIEGNAQSRVEPKKTCKTIQDWYTGEMPRDSIWLEPKNLAVRYWNAAADLDFEPAKTALTNWNAEKAAKIASAGVAAQSAKKDLKE